MQTFVSHTDQVNDWLAGIHSAVNAIAPAADVKAVLALVASFVCLYVLQSMTWEAGWRSFTAVLRLIQRVSLGVISCVLMLMAASIVADDTPPADALSVLFLIPFLAMLLATAVLVHRQNHPAGKEASGRPKIWMFGSRGPIR